MPAASLFFYFYAVLRFAGFGKSKTQPTIFANELREWIQR
jgi:hypothetical protein